jgi:catechol 2,3-dioxygenase-like lactoylglutathione lyase family enzyme/N-acetylglutamate synthase-like GNAT family acetyltransferase
VHQATRKLKSLNYSLRPALESDAAAVEACVHAAYQHYIKRIGRKPGPMLDDYPEVIRTRQVTVAESGGSVAGVLVLDRTAEGFLLENIAVDPAHKGKGLGRTLFELAEAEAKRAGFDSIYLYTHELMAENRALYARIGYVEYDRRVDEGLPRVFMRKKLVRTGSALGLVSLVVRDYDEALAFFCGKLGFELVEDTPVPAQGKRWVVVKPAGAGGGAGLLLARAASPEQESRVGDQTGGRVFLFLHTDDFWRDFNAYKSKGVVFVRGPAEESYGTVAVFKDLYGNLWDLLQLKTP